MIRCPKMSQLIALLLCAQATAAVPSPQAASSEASFNREINPLLKQYCLVCHSAAKHTGDINLEQFTSFKDVVNNPHVWQKVIDQLSIGEMPPKPMPQPSQAERARLLAFANSALSIAARAHAGDPGPVLLRRLNNAEYTYTVRDLTGVASLDPAKEFPADGAAGEGFTNTGNALGMSPSLVTKYLNAGKGIASHAVLLPDGIRFSAGASRRDWTDEILAEIRNFYAEFTEAGGAETWTQQGIALDQNRGGGLPLQKCLTASLALRGTSGTTAVENVARKNGLSPKYLAALVDLLKSPRPSPLLDGLRTRWRTATPADVDAMVTEIARWQDTLWKFSSVGHIGKADGPKAWMEPVDPVVEQQEFRIKLAPAAGADDVTVYLTAHDAGDGSAGDFVVWQEPKLVIRGRPPVQLRDLRSFISELTARRARIFAAAANSLLAAEEANTDTGALASRFGVDPEAMKAWFDFLGIHSSGDFKLDLLTKKIQKSGTYDFVQGWGSTELPMLLANSSDQHVRVPGNMKPHGVAVHPSQTLNGAVAWRSPMAATLRVEGTIARAHAECGTGVTWSLELRRGNTRQRLADGMARNATPVALGPFERVRVQPGDLISILIGPREGNYSCALTDVDLHLTTVGTAPQQQWSLREDVAGSVLAANPHPDKTGRPAVWSFYTEPVAGTGVDTALPSGSLLARWQATEQPDERHRLAKELQTLLTSNSPPTEGADASLYRQLTSLAGPLFASSMTGSAATPNSARPVPWGLDPVVFGQCPGGTRIEPASLCVNAPSVLAVRLPADLVANSEFVTTGRLDHTIGAEGSVQLEVQTAKPQARSGLLTAGTLVVDAKGQWTSNNQSVSYAMPVVVNEHSAARKRVETNFQEFRMMFPSALCYTKIVPVDEVVTLTLFYREDDHLSRLILNDQQKAKLDRLWEELHYISRDAITQVDVFEQLWQYATQDADPTKFEPLRKPIQERAAAFRQHLIDTEPRHVQAVIEFADRAYRRPLRESEKSQLHDLYAQLRAQGLPHEDSIRLLLARVLVAPSFLYRAEDAAPGKQPGPVGDYELADRLSYFLWSSMPDAELRAAAATGKLRTPAGLQAQSHRMLSDERVRRMATEFGIAWLQLSGFDTLDEKSERYFPSFPAVRGAMYEEPIRFFADLFAHNGSVLSLLDADYTFLNEALAKHYGIPGVTGPEWRKVDGIQQYSRGGIFGEAAVLAKQSGASRTSPILRGNWIMEVLLGEKLPRPPKDVPQLPADEATETLSVRELIEKHASDPRCAGCHSRLDPYGYTLERFDAIGRYRDKDLGGRPINDRATFKDGADVQGIDGLRAYLLTTGRDAFVRQFCKKLLGYSLGRAVQLSDDLLLNEIQARLAATGYHVSTAIDMIVASPQFREIRGRDYEQQHE
jgi:hypothetical protein